MSTPCCDVGAARHVLQRLHLDLQRFAKLEHAAGEEHRGDGRPVSLAAVIDVLRVAVGDLINVLTPKGEAAIGIDNKEGPYDTAEFHNR